MKGKGKKLRFNFPFPLNLSLKCLTSLGCENCVSYLLVMTS